MKLKVKFSLELNCFVCWILWLRQVIFKNILSMFLFLFVHFKHRHLQVVLENPALCQSTIWFWPPELLVKTSFMADKSQQHYKTCDSCSVEKQLYSGFDLLRPCCLINPFKPRDGRLMICFNHLTSSWLKMNSFSTDSE